MTWGIWGKNLDTHQMVALMHHDLDQGITTFDHADIYGDYSTEEAFGHAFAKANIPRDTIQLISKCGIQYRGNARPENRVKHYQYDSDYIVWSAERSLRLLQTDYLDVLLLHRPSALMEAESIAEAVDKLQQAGKIRAFGVSNFRPSQTALVATQNTIAVNQIEFSLTAPEAMLNGSLDDIQVQGVLPMSWSPLGSYFKADNAQSARIKAVLEPLTKKYETTADQLLLAWVMQHPAGVHPVIGTTRSERIAAAVQAQKITLELQDWFLLLEASQGHKVP